MGEGEKGGVLGNIYTDLSASGKVSKGTGAVTCENNEALVHEEHKIGHICERKVTSVFLRGGICEPSAQKMGWVTGG